MLQQGPSHETGCQKAACHHHKLPFLVRHPSSSLPSLCPLCPFVCLQQPVPPARDVALLWLIPMLWADEDTRSSPDPTQLGRRCWRGLIQLTERPKRWIQKEGERTRSQCCRGPWTTPGWGQNRARPSELYSLPTSPPSHLYPIAPVAAGPAQPALGMVGPHCPSIVGWWVPGARTHCPSPHCLPGDTGTFATQPCRRNRDDPTTSSASDRLQQPGAFSLSPKSLRIPARAILIRAFCPAGLSAL